MRGVVLAGGSGSRLYPLTKDTNKHLLPVADREMVRYPLDVLVQNGITEIMLVSSGQYIPVFKELLSGTYPGCEFTYAVQDNAGGIAQALGLAEPFVAGEDVAVILGDNIYQQPPDLSGFSHGARIYLKEVPDASRFGVATLSGERVVRIVEKPQEPETNFAVTGLYVYDARVFDIIKTLRPSARNELEITDVNNAYIALQQLEARFVNGWWTDAGTFESLERANALLRGTYEND